MKKQILNSLTTAFFLSLVIFISCGGGGDDEPSGPTPAEEQFDKLAKTWIVTSARADGSDVDGWDQLTITFAGTATAGTYSTNSQQPDGTTQVWPASGSWVFKSDTELNTIIRDNAIEIGLAVSDNQATLTFEIVDNGGRSDIVEGNWTFVLQPQP